MHTYLAPDGVLYLLVKLCVLMLALLLWWVVTAPAVV